MHTIILRLIVLKSLSNGDYLTLMPFARTLSTRSPVGLEFKSVFRFFQEELSWGQGKVDDILLPIIQKMNKRGQVCFSCFFLNHPS